MFGISSKLFRKTINKQFFFAKISGLVELLATTRISIDEGIASSVANQIAALAIVYEYVFTKPIYYMGKGIIILLGTKTLVESMALHPGT